MTDDELDDLCLSTSLALQITVEYFDEDWVGTVQRLQAIELQIDDTLMPWLSELPEQLEAAGIEAERGIASTRVNLDRWRRILTPMFPDLGNYEQAATEGTSATDDLVEIVYELERACIVLDYAGERGCCGYLRFSHRTEWGARWERLHMHITRL